MIRNFNILKFMMIMLGIIHVNMNSYGLDISLENKIKNYANSGKFQEGYDWCINEIGEEGDELSLFKLYRALGYMSSRLGNYTEAIEWAKKALQLSNPGDQKHADVLSDLAKYHSRDSQYENALELGIMACEEYLKIGGKSVDYASAINNVSHYYYKVGSYTKALEICNDALTILAAIVPNSLIHANCLSNMAHYYSRLGNYPEAVRLSTLVLEIYDLNTRHPHPDYANVLSDQATYFSRMGDYTKAKECESEAMQIRSNNLGNHHPDYATSLTRLAHFNYKLGDVDQAISLGLEACRIREKRMSRFHLDYLEGKTDLAKYYANSDSLDKAIKITKEIINIRDRYYGNNADYANVLSNLGSFYARKGDFSLALELEQRVLNVREGCLSKDHPNYARSLVQISYYYYQLKKFKEALKFAEMALPIQKRILGLQHPDFLANIINISKCGFGIGDYYKGVECSQLATYIVIDRIKNCFLNLTNAERKKLWMKNNEWLTQDIPYYCFLSGCEEMVSYACDAILFSKGILLHSEIEFGKFLADTSDPVLREKFENLQLIQKWLKTLYEKPLLDREVDTDSLELICQTLEQDLVKGCKEYGAFTRNLSVSWSDIRNHIGPKDVAIEFVKFKDSRENPIYTAYVWKYDMTYPKLVKLFEEKDLTNLIDEDDKASIYTNRSARDLIWGKLQPQLEGVENIYFAPDGILHQIAIEYLPDLDGEGMISDKYNLHRLSSTREIALNRHYVPTKEAVVYGGIKYDTDVSIMETESRKYERPKHRGFSPYYNLSDSLALRGSLEYLDGSLKEAENINGMMKENNYNSIFLSGNDATEESFKSLSGKANGIIHISTHGFYWTESEAERKASLNDRLMFMSQLGDNTRRNVEDKALTRTGLFMAGAKNALGGVELPEDVDDGILTAQEIANLDLRGLDLVVLSACQTGMGDISGDGVFGLQRGFKKAGANTILMSLWDVSDEATQILMTQFYKNYLGGMSKQQALRDAQKAVRETPGFEDPEYWAAFILLDAIN